MKCNDLEQMGIRQLWVGKTRKDKKVYTSEIPIAVSNYFTYSFRFSRGTRLIVQNVAFEVTQHALGRLLIGDCVVRGLSM